MRRKRQQTGYIFKARGHWYVRYFEDRMVDGKLRHDRVAKQIGEVTTRGKRPPLKIEDEAREIVVATVTNATPERALAMSKFVDRVYFPHVKQFKRPSTLKGYKDIWENHVKARCAGVWLKEVRTFHVQGWLDAIASPGALGRNSLKHIKTFLSALFKLAKQQGYYSGGEPCSRYCNVSKGPSASGNLCLRLDRDSTDAFCDAGTRCNNFRRCCIHGT